MTGLPIRVLVTPRSMTQRPPSSLDRLRQLGAQVVIGPPGRQPTPAELPSLLEGVTAWIAGVEHIGESALAAAPELRLIARNGAGLDTVDLEAAAGRGVRVLGTPGANAAGVAELAVALILDCLRQVSASAAELAVGRWDRRLGRELGSSVVGAVGVGDIGSRVGRIARAFGADVIGHDPYAPLAVATEFELVSLPDLLARADVVTLHTPGFADGSPLIGRAELAMLRPSAVLVNTARWSLVDSNDLLDALEDGRVAAYAVDAFAEEPPAPHALLGHPRVIATPHLGAFTAESVGRAANAAIDNVANFLEENTRATSRD